MLLPETATPCKPESSNSWRPMSVLRTEQNFLSSSVPAIAETISIPDIFAKVVAISEAKYPTAFKLSCGIILDYDNKDTVWTKEQYLADKSIQRFIHGTETNKILTPYQMQYDTQMFKVGDLYKADNRFLQLRGFLPSISVDHAGKHELDILGVFGEEGSYIHRLQKLVKTQKNIPHIQVLLYTKEKKNKR